MQYGDMAKHSEAMLESFGKLVQYARVELLQLVVLWYVKLNSKEG